MIRRHSSLKYLLTGAALLASSAVIAQDNKTPGVTDTEIKIGNTAPYSGPASSLGIAFQTAAAYFKKINDEGGINGRKINFITYDDAYSPPKTVEQTRRLVEDDEVALIFGSLGSATNAATQKYLNAKGVPQLFIMAAASRFNDPKQFPWTMPWPLNTRSEGEIAAAHIQKNLANEKIGVLYQNDDFGRDILMGFKSGLGENRSNIVGEVSYETTDPTIDSAIVKLRSAGATVLFSITTPKFSAQTIRRAAEMGWKPAILLPQVSASIGAVIKPAGVENAKGTVYSWLSFKDPTNPDWNKDEPFEKWSAFMTKYYPNGNKSDAGTVGGYLLAQTLEIVLRAAGKDLTRENIMKQAASLNRVKLDMLLPGMSMTTTPDDFLPIEQAQVVRFNGEAWETVGPLIDARKQ